MPQVGQTSGSPLISSTWSARNRPLQLVQSTMGSVKTSSWPEACQTRRAIRMLASRPTTSSRMRVIVVPPVALDVVLELDAEWAVVEDRVDSAVDFAAGEYVTAPFAQRDNVLHAVVAFALVHNSFPCSITAMSYGYSAAIPRQKDA